MKIEFLPHTADVEMRVEADSLPTLLKGAMLGMGKILKPGFCNRYANYPIKQEVLIKAVDSTCLLIDFLSEVLTLCYTEKALFCELQFVIIENTGLHAQLFGRQVNGFDEEIKAVTYHGADVRQNANGYWETCVIFDI